VIGAASFVLGHPTQHGQQHMKATFFRLTAILQKLCYVIAGVCLVGVTLIIPWGVFTRYVLDSASSWPEPLAVLMMIWFTFIAATLCYRENLHIAVNLVFDLLPPRGKVVLAWIREILVGATAVFLLYYGTSLVMTTWHQVIAEFPMVSVGLSYLPIPLGGGIMALFVIERMLLGPTQVKDPLQEEIAALTATAER
jgi:TRAP-type C4-dicarboxylate transport system permease small subunit